MRRATLITIGVLLAVPAGAQAKAGVVFDRYPETVKVGDNLGFTVMAWRPPPPEGGAGHPVVGVHPLVTFRSVSGKVIRVRTGRTDLNGLGYGEVRFTDKGPWTTELNTRGVDIGSEYSAPIKVGSGLTQTIPAADQAPARAAGARGSADAADARGSAGSGWPVAGLLGIAAAALASGLLALRIRRRHWGAT